MGEEVRITVIATGFEDRERSMPTIGKKEEEIKSVFNSKRPFYSPATFTKKKTIVPQPEVEDEVKEVEAPLFTTKPVAIESANFFGSAQSDKNNDADDDLEIPAFIRKKMGKR